MFSISPNHEAVARWHGKLPSVLEVGLALALAVPVASLLWIVLTPTGPVGVLEAATTSPTPPPSMRGTDVFFRQSTAASSPAGDGEALGYTLFGVRPGVENEGAAILAHDSDPQVAYQVGDLIAPGLVLDAVGADHVVLRSQHKRHRIDMPKYTPTAAPAIGALPSVGTEPAAIDPRQLLAQAGLQVRAAGGYTVIPRGDGAVLRQAGLQSGDVLLSVNGQSLTPERLGELNEELKGQSQVSITFERDGQTQTITLPASPP